MKMNKKRPILRRAAIPAVLALLCTLFWFGKPNDFGLGRNMELLVNMMRELSLFYVDEVDPDQLMQDAAEGMTRNLDPYTEFLPEEQMSNFDLLTTGKYGGIGSMIRKKGRLRNFRTALRRLPGRPGRHPHRRQDPLDRRRGHQGLGPRTDKFRPERHAQHHRPNRHRTADRRRARHSHSDARTGSHSQRPLRRVRRKGSDISSTATSPKDRTKRCAPRSRNSAHRIPCGD